MRSRLAGTGDNVGEQLLPFVRCVGDSWPLTQVRWGCGVSWMGVLRHGRVGRVRGRWNSCRVMKLALLDYGVVDAWVMESKVVG